MSNKHSLIFSDEDIVEHSEYPLAVRPDAFLDKLREILEYDQDYTYNTVIPLDKAEAILMMARQLK